MKKLTAELIRNTTKDGIVNEYLKGHILCMIEEHARVADAYESIVEEFEEACDGHDFFMVGEGSPLEFGDDIEGQASCMDYDRHMFYFDPPYSNPDEPGVYVNMFYDGDDVIYTYAWGMRKSN